MREFTRQYEQQIQKALAFIPNASVAVHVDIDNLKSSVTRNERTRVRGDSNPTGHWPRTIEPISFANERTPHGALRVNRDGLFDLTSDEQIGNQPHESRQAGSPPHENSETLREVSEQQLLAAMPRAVQVSVSIPRDYYRDVAAIRKTQGEKKDARLNLDTIEEEMISKVERTVARLIPANSSHEAISVTTVDQLPTDSLQPTLTTNEQLLVLAQRHGGSCALCLFAVWALWMLTRLTAAPARAVESSSIEPTEPRHEFMSPEPAPEPTSTIPSPSTVPVAPLPSTPVPASSPTSALASSSLHEEIRSLAESDPATAASVLGRWLAEANA